MDFHALYAQEAPAVAGFFLRRVGDAEAAADLTAETFAAALGSVRRYDPKRGEPAQWLFGIARHQLAAYHRRGRVADCARRRLGMERLELTDAALARFEADALLDAVPDGDLVRARIVDDRPYAELAAARGLTEPATRKRVSRALARLRREWP